MEIASDRLVADRTATIFQQQREQVFRRTDRLFAALLVLQWLGGIVAAWIISPRTWAGAHSEIHPHVWAAVFLGGLLASYPVYRACRYPGRLWTRHVIALTQMMFSSLFIHISGGRIETHFHVFGSLAFLAFYRDWTVLIPATVLVAADHFLRGVFWPETVFGIGISSPWRWLEHAAWVLFEDVFLIISCRQGTKDLWNNARDTAELERMNTANRERNMLLEQAYLSKHAIVETALDAVVSTNAEGVITGWNSRAEHTFGWSAEEALGRNLAETIIPASFRAKHCEGVRRFRQTGTSQLLNRRIEMAALHRDGHEFPVELAIAPIGGGDNLTFCAFVRDITERRQAAEALRRAKDAAEAANRAKSAFLAHMSHEIRTPLNGILGFADILLKIGSEVTEAQRREYVTTINRSGRHLLGVINDVLDLSKIEAGQMEVDVVRCASHEIIADAVSILRAKAREKGIRLESRWIGRVPETIATDPSRFRQLLMNLIGNAVKFTQTGSVEVVARLDHDAKPARLVVEVIDTGIGIAAEHLQSIFKPFNQADQSITRRFGGTGLGLAISCEIARLLGGELRVESELGRGSRFTATIAVGSIEGVRHLEAPICDLIPRAATAPGEFPTLPPATILLVEDGETNRKLISLILRRAGAKVMTAEDGRAGVDLALAHRFDLILMDMQMPVMDGYMAATELRRQGVTIPIVALTANSMRGDEEQCRAAGCSGYLTKPIDCDRLLNAVGQMLRSASAYSGGPGPLSAGDEPLFPSLPMDDPDFRELVGGFVDELTKRIDRMRGAALDEDFAVLAGIGHWLKGSAGSAGLNVFTVPALELEQAAKAGEAAAVARSLDRISRLAARIVVAPPGEENVRLCAAASRPA